MPLSAGSKLGPYEILSLLGAGGMGEVYKARDTRLERTVAVKVLPAHTASSPEARQRFEREARTISQLSHPHICALYDVGREGDVEYLVMELLEGETLSDRLAKGPLSRDQTLRYGEQIADALDKAHRQGVVHRDLKPANVMLTKTGVKLLDFGLAKGIAAADPAGGTLTSLPTQQQQKGLTQEGTILGTFQYMAPEQLEGKEADARTDIHALGAVLYEMATGRKAFVAASQASLITAIMSADPPSITSLLPMAPPALDRIVRTCLAKDPEERWQSAADVRRELRWIAEGSAAGEGASIATASHRRRRVRERVAWAVAALAVIGAAFGLWRPRPSRSAPELVRFPIPAPAGHRFAGFVSMSPEGRRLLIVLRDKTGVAAWVRSFDTLAMRRLPGTEGARYGFWSPDGREVAFFSGGKLKRTSADGGPVRTICDSGSGFGGTWAPDGTILFTAEFGTPIVAVAAAGGTPRPVTKVDTEHGEVAHFFPNFLPDGRHFVFVARHLDAEKTEVRLGSLDEKTSVPLFRSDTAALYADPGYLLFAKDNAVFAWRFDPSRGRLSGDALPAFEGVKYGTEENRLFASAAAGRFAYLPWPQRRSLVWVDRHGRELATLGDVACYEDVRVSTDGRRVAAARRDPEHGQNLDLWVLDASRGTSARLTSERGDEFSPAWSPDGERLFFISDRGGSGYYDLYEVPAGGGPAKVLLSTKQDKTIPSISSDGRILLFNVSEGAHYSRHVLTLPDGGAPRREQPPTRFNESHPEISPDGRWVAFDSDESGNTDIYVEPLAGGTRRMISVGGGQAPIWRRDGQELYYVAPNGDLMAVTLKFQADGVSSAEPQRLFAADIGADLGREFFRRAYDAAPDGERFLIIRRAPGAEPEDAIVVLNWTAALAGKDRP